MRVYIGSDHAGFQLKNQLKEYFAGKKLDNGQDLTILDLGVFTNDPTDYPDIAREVGEKVRENEGTLGVLICGSGVGMSMAANKMKGIRAVLANNEITAKLSREHNDANIICLGERLTGRDLAVDIVWTFLNTKFDGAERHQRRVEKVEGIAA
jgi:ribose 5-phosphate isomerase B